MHACIAAFSSGTPVMPVAYSRKFSGLFGTLGYDFLLPVRGMDTQAALDFLMEGLGKREMMRMAIMARMKRIDALLDNYRGVRSEEHTSELQSLMRISYAVFCLKKKIKETNRRRKSNYI